MAMAMKSENNRIYKYLKDEGVISTPSLVLAMAEFGQSAEDIQKAISDLKTDGRWDPLDRKYASAYMVACRRSDKSLRDLLIKEGVSLSSGCLTYALVRFVDEVEYVFETLKRNKLLDPSDNSIARALVWAVEYKNKAIEDKLNAEGVILNMACLVSAVEPSFYMSTLETVISGIKRNNKWEPDCDDALQTLNVAVKRYDESVHQKLIYEGLKWKTRNLYVAVQHETVWGLKQVIKQMKTMKLIDPHHEEIKTAVQLAKSFKDKRKFKLLREEELAL